MLTFDEKRQSYSTHLGLHTHMNELLTNCRLHKRSFELFLNRLLRQHCKVQLERHIDTMKFWSKLGWFIKYYWKSVVLIAAPLLYLPLAVTGNKAMQAAYVILLVGTYWMTEVVDLAVSSLIPIVLLPVFQILTPGRVASMYMKDVTLMLTGSLMVSKAVEKQNLHQRLALLVLRMMGPNPVLQYLGFMISAWFMSMWITNTASTAMVLTLAISVLRQMKIIEGLKEDDDEQDEDVQIEKHAVLEIEMKETISPNHLVSSEENIKSSRKRLMRFEKGLYLSVAYAATCGGIGTLTGTGPNMVLMGFIEERYGSKTGLNFGSYMLFATPLSVIVLIGAWFILSLRYIGPRRIFCKAYQQTKEKSDQIRAIIAEKYRLCGPMKYGEVSVLVLFCVLVLLWILREPGVPLWGSLFLASDSSGKITKYWTDGTSAILITILIFILPAENPFKNSNPPRLLNWRVACHEFPWGLLFLFGGGFALAEACIVSGLSGVVGQALTKLAVLPPYVVVLVLSLGISFLTEVASNTATSTIMIPIILKMAECIRIHPMRMGLAAGIACSFSFCMPAATPPNAIIFSTGKIRVLDMVSTGLFLNIFCVFVLSVLSFYYTIPIFGTDVYPDWAMTNCSGNN